MSSTGRALFSIVVLSLLGSGCLERPVVRAHPTTSNQFVDQVPGAGVDKIDLLFMVDNSASMADKQEILASAVPVLVNRLTSPICVDPVSGAPTGENSKRGACVNGEPEFPPVADIHVGIVTSSLGAHGGSQCPDKPWLTPNDRAHLLGTVRPAESDASLPSFPVAQTWNNSGFLAWDAAQKAVPPGTSDPRAFQAAFTDMIGATRETGCGYEASLESWYRFLIDPEPPANVTKQAGKTVRGSALVKQADGSSVCQGCDLELLAQRKAFLRPDSLVAIVMLSDENDCSVRDDGVGWFVTTDSEVVNGKTAEVRMPRATAECEANPNDKCCRSCASAGATPDGCRPLSEDPVCKGAPAGSYNTWDARGDHPNLRCYDQKRRFGFDLLYPTSRYVTALTSPMLTLDSDHQTQVLNPLYAAGEKRGPRAPSQVFLAGIVGVPWQDIADDASRTGPGLKYLSSAELVAKDRWTTLLGKPEQSPPVPPSDPFMVEASLPRSGTNPITSDPIVPPSATSPTASPINGHEQNVPELDDLQYACTFPLAAPKPCASGTACDCSASPSGDASQVTLANSPLCQPPAGGPASTVQRYAKAYPGIRELQVLKDLSEQGIVASICPKVTASADRASDPNYGYNPAVAAIIERLKTSLVGKCLPRVIGADPSTHQVECTVIEAQPGGCGDCSQAGRGPADPALAEAVRRQLHDTGHCGGDQQPACESFCQCEILQEQGPALDACRQGRPARAGFCYIDDPASPLVENCPTTEKRLLHFVNGEQGETPTPAPNALAFVACIGQPLASASTDGGS